MRWPKVCVIILNWNRLADTLEALESVINLDYPDYEIMVVDNGSEGDDADVLRRKFRSVINVLAMEKNHGFAEGNNIAVEHALRTVKPEYIAFLNNDAVVETNWLSELIKPFLGDNAGRIAVTAPTIIDYHDRDRIRFGNDSRMNIFGQVRHSQKQNTGAEMRLVTGASFVMRSSVLNSLEEFFCAEYFAYYEDVDLSWRLRNLGYRLVHVPTCLAFHKESATAGSQAIEARMLVLKTRNKYMTFYRNLSLGEYALVLPLLFWYDLAVMIGVAICRRDVGLARAKLAGIVESFSSLRKIRHIGGGSFSYLDKRLYLDKLG